MQQQQQYLVLVRHGERLDDEVKVSDQEREEYKQYSHDYDVLLSANGKQQGIKTGQKLKSILECKEIKLYSSPYTRCIQTMTGIVQGLGLQKADIEIMEQFSEMTLASNIYDDDDNVIGHPQQIGSLYLNKYDSAQYKQHFIKQFLPTVDIINHRNSENKDKYFMMEYPDTADQMDQRYQQGFELVDKMDNKVSLIVSHGNSHQSLMSYLGMKNDYLQGVEYCATTVLVKTETEGWKVVGDFADSTHVGLTKPNVIRLDG